VRCDEAGKGLPVQLSTARACPAKRTGATPHALQPSMAMTGMTMDLKMTTIDLRTVMSS
jgi:hypothetical protein